MAVARLWWITAAAMGNNGGAMGGRTAKQSQLVMGQCWHDGQHGEGQTITTNAEAVQLEVTQDERQQGSWWTAVAWSQWMVAVVMGNIGSAMGGVMVEQLQWATRRQQHEMITTNVEVAQWEFGILDFVLAKFTAS
jgi:hypothetical protein